MRNKIDSLIKEALKNGEKDRLETFRAIKTAFVVYTSQGKNFEMTDSVELDILRTLIKQREKSAKEYRDAGREDLGSKELTEIEIIKEFVPKEPGREEIIEVIKDCDDSYITANGKIEIQKKVMGNVMKFCKAKLPSASGKLISDIIKEFLV